MDPQGGSTVNEGLGWDLLVITVTGKATINILDTKVLLKDDVPTNIPRAYLSSPEVLVLPSSSIRDDFYLLQGVFNSYFGKTTWILMGLAGKGTQISPLKNSSWILGIHL